MIQTGPQPTNLYWGVFRDGITHVPTAKDMNGVSTESFYEKFVRPGDIVFVALGCGAAVAWDPKDVSFLNKAERDSGLRHAALCLIEVQKMLMNAVIGGAGTKRARGSRSLFATCPWFDTETMSLNFTMNPATGSLLERKGFDARHSEVVRGTENGAGHPGVHNEEPGRKPSSGAAADVGDAEPKPGVPEAPADGGPRAFPRGRERNAVRNASV